MSESSGGLEFFAGFLVGALAGAAAALLLTPQSGQETRTLIHDKSIELRDHAASLSAEARKRAEAIEAQAKEKAAELQTQAKVKAAGLQTQAKERSGGLRAKVQRAVEEGKAAAKKRQEELLSQVEQPPAEIQVPEG